MKNIVFLFSLPRAGSTLLQRILMSHKDVASVAEPWLMLPFCYAFKKDGVLTEYSHATCYVAFEDFIKNLPKGENDYFLALRDFAFRLYEKHCSNNERYFLDKTPRYYNIIPEINRIFPDAKFVFLFRNPVQILASIINTWGDGRFKCLYRYYSDLNEGVRLLSEGYELLKDKSYGMQYEKFIINPGKYLKEICNYLEIEFFEETMLSSFSNQNTKGRMGDPVGVKQYKDITASTLHKWENTFNNSFRKNYVINYIDKLDENVLTVQGYDKNKILEDLKKIKVRNGLLLQDKLDVLYCELVKIIKANIWFGKSTKRWAKNRFLD